MVALKLKARDIEPLENTSIAVALLGNGENHNDGAALANGPTFIGICTAGLVSCNCVTMGLVCTVVTACNGTCCIQVSVGCSCGDDVLNFLQ